MFAQGHPAAKCQGSTWVMPSNLYQWTDREALECDDQLMNRCRGTQEGLTMLYGVPTCRGCHSTLSQRRAPQLGRDPPFPKLSSVCVSGSIQAQTSFQEWP